ncbi:MAG: hypothetical protein AAF443_00885 [Chlamydiota bacterium]
MIRRIIFILVAIGVAASQNLISVEDTLNTSVTFAEVAVLTMQDINIEAINPVLATAIDSYVSAATGALIAESSSSTGYTVTINAVNGTDIVAGLGWNMTDASSSETLEFSLLANKDKNGTSTPITTTGLVSGTATEGTDLIEGAVVIDCPTQDISIKNWMLHAYIHQGEINAAAAGTYTAPLKMTLTANS